MPDRRAGVSHRVDGTRQRRAASPVAVLSLKLPNTSRRSNKRGVSQPEDVQVGAAATASTQTMENMFTARANFQSRTACKHRYRLRVTEQRRCRATAAQRTAASVW